MREAQAGGRGSGDETDRRKKWKRMRRKINGRRRRRGRARTGK